MRVVRRAVPRRRTPARALATLAVLACLAGPTLTAAVAQGPPGQMSVTVVPPSGTSAPTPGGRIIFSIDGREIYSAPVGSGAATLTQATPLTSVTGSLLGRSVTVSYSGDSNYEASAGTTVTFPTSDGLTIVLRPKDTDAPTAEILSPGDGVRYARREPVIALYTCADPEARSLVTRCEGTVPTGGLVDTSSPGTFTFAVQTRDALGNAATRTVSYEVAGSAAALQAPATANRRRGGGPPPLALRDVDTTVASIVAAIVPPATPSPRREEPAPAPPAQATRGPSATPPAAGTPSERVDAHRAGSQPVEPYDPRSEPAKAVGILVAAFTLLALAALRGPAAGRAGGPAAPDRRRAAAVSGQGGPGQSGPGSGRQPSSGPRSSYQHWGIDYLFLGAGYGAVAIGDKSRTWAWPGTRRLDTLAATIPVRLGSRSPLFARVAADGTYLRAILGSASLLAPLCGLALGVLAVSNTGGEALPPVAALTIAIAVLGVLDAAAGLVAVLTFTLGVILSGGVQSGADARLMFGLAMLWFALPLMAGLARPLRRPPSRSLEESWDRGADFVIASLIGAWAVQKIIFALPGLAGEELAIVAYANDAALWVLAALVVRLGLETVASHLYPRRLDMTAAPNVPTPGAVQKVLAIALRTALFVYFAHLFTGNTWQLWAGALMFLIPQLLWAFAPHLPNSKRLYRWVPQGLVFLVLTVFVFAAIGALLISNMDEGSPTFLANTFVIFSVPFFVLGLIGPFGRDGDPRPIGWGKRLAGVALLVAGVLQVLGHII